MNEYEAHWKSLGWTPTTLRTLNELMVSMLVATYSGLGTWWRQAMVERGWKYATKEVCDIETKVG